MYTRLVSIIERHGLYKNYFNEACHHNYYVVAIYNLRRDCKDRQLNSGKQLWDIWENKSKHCRVLKKPHTFQIFWIIFRIVDPMGGWAGIIATSVTDAFATSNVLLWLIHPLSISLWLEAFWFSITSLCSLLDMNIEFWYIDIQKWKDVQMKIIYCPEIPHCMFKILWYHWIDKKCISCYMLFGNYIYHINIGEIRYVLITWHSIKKLSRFWPPLGYRDISWCEIMHRIKCTFRAAR